MPCVQREEPPGGSPFRATVELWNRRNEGTPDERALLQDLLGTAGRYWLEIVAPDGAVTEAGTLDVTG